MIAPRVGFSYPQTDPIGSACRPVLGRPGAPRLRGCVPGIRVPRRIHRDRALHDVDVIVYAGLLAMRAGAVDTVPAGVEVFADDSTPAAWPGVPERGAP